MLIGLSVNYKEGTSRIADAYVNAVVKAGGVPVLIPLTTDKSVLESIVSNIDGLILTGGGDIYAPLFGEELHPAVDDYNIDRDNYDIALVKLATDRQMPVLGICRGHQVVNVAFGGTLIQDIPSQVPESKIVHSQEEVRDVGTQTVRITPQSKLHQIVQTDTLWVNSFHHQAVKDLAPGFDAVAFSEDGIIEAIESNEGKAIVGVQWHPETMAVAGNEIMTDTFKYLVKEADLFNKAKALHKKIISIDTHCDTPLLFAEGVDIGKKSKAKVDVIKMQEGMLDAIFMAAYLHQGELTDTESQKAVNKAVNILNQIKKQIEKNKDIVAQGNSVADLIKNKAEGKKTIFLCIENAYAIGKDLKNLEGFAKMGVKYITLCHNGDNDVCESNTGNHKHNGLSDFGKEVVKEMNRLGIMVDISHTSEKTSFDVLKISKFPVIASHSSVKALCNHPRNISDELMKAIAKKKGVIQICLYSNFLKKGEKATVKDAVDHIDYIVKTVGIDYVGIGSDFDGGGGLVGLQSVGEFPQITMELIRRGYSDSDIAKIWGENLMRVMKETNY
jgi:microsomal dipeptidase-like Zn-dependent dipeptidase/gamma-glutamyl-gamma-aminobutyrate hydrolase PuuD